MSKHTIVSKTFGKDHPNLAMELGKGIALNSVTYLFE